MYILNTTGVIPKSTWAKVMDIYYSCLNVGITPPKEVSNLHTASFSAETYNKYRIDQLTDRRLSLSVEEGTGLIRLRRSKISNCGKTITYTFAYIPVIIKEIRILIEEDGKDFSNIKIEAVFKGTEADETYKAGHDLYMKCADFGLTPPKELKQYKAPPTTRQVVLLSPFANGIVLEYSSNYCNYVNITLYLQIIKGLFASELEAIMITKR